MKLSKKIIITTIMSLLSGVFIGMFVTYHYIGGIFQDLVVNWSYTNSIYEPSNKIGLLKKLRKYEIEEAISQIEQNLDSNIINLGSLISDESDLSKEKKEKIIELIVIFKNYRNKYPKEYQNKEMESLINETLTKIE